ncbi:MAG: class I SAM-dependent methyltransferase [Pseudomonadota bacterium]
MTTTLVRRYDRASQTWHGKIARLGYLTAYRHLIAQAALGPRLRQALDAGCGTGAFALMLQDMAAPGRIDLLDLSASMRAAARKNLHHVGGRVGAEFSSLSSNDVPRGAYDVILAAHFIEHLDDPARALSRFARCLAPGGTVLLAVSKPHWCTALIRFVWGHQAFQPNTVMAWAEAAGFDATSVAFPSGPPSRTSMGYILRARA